MRGRALEFLATCLGKSAFWKLFLSGFTILMMISWRQSLKDEIIKHAIKFR